MSTDPATAAKPVASVCECGQLRVTGIYSGAISCPLCNGTPRSIRDEQIVGVPERVSAYTGTVNDERTQA